MKEDLIQVALMVITNNATAASIVHQLLLCSFGQFCLPDVACLLDEKLKSLILKTQYILAGSLPCCQLNLQTSLFTFHLGFFCCGTYGHISSHQRNPHHHPNICGILFDLTCSLPTFWVYVTTNTKHILTRPNLLPYLFS